MNTEATNTVGNSVIMPCKWPQSHCRHIKFGEYDGTEYDDSEDDEDDDDSQFEGWDDEPFN